MIKLLIKQFSPAITLAAFLGVVNAVSSIVILDIINKFVVASLKEGDVFPVLSYAVLAVFLLGLGIAAQYSISRIGVMLVHRLREGVIQKIISTNIDKLDFMGGHKLYANITSDIDAIAGLVRILPVFISNVLLLVFAAIYLGSLSMPASLAICLNTSTSTMY